MKWHLFHKWSKWESYTWIGKTTMLRGPTAGRTFDTNEQRQKRRCDVCNKVQDELVS